MVQGFESERVEREWVAAGSPRCDHPKFVIDRGPFGKDEQDEHCTVCGIIRLRGSQITPPSRGEYPLA